MTDFKDKNKRKGHRDTRLVDGKMPPQAIDFEQAVLGALMLEAETINTIADILEPRSFYVDAHARIYSAIYGLYKKSYPIDILTVCKELRALGELDIIGGAYVITELTNRVASAANCEFHARVVAQKFMQRELIRICTESINNAYDDGCDVFDLFDTHEKAYTGVLKNITTGKTENMGSLFNQMIERNDALLQNKGISGLSTGFPVLDRVTGGWQNTELTIIAARPSMGKTALAANFARNAAVDSRAPVAFFSLEMSALSIATRIFAAEADLSTSDFIRRGIDADKMVVVHNSCTQIINSNLFIDDTPAITIMELRSKARKLMRDHKIKLIVIDYLQLMRGDKDAIGRNGNREQEIASISRGLKQLAKELSIPVIALAQLSRASETRGGDKRPQLSDLRESGAIEQDADVVMFIHRPEYYNIFEDEAGNSTVGMADIITAKNRNGPVGTETIGYTAPSTKFYSLESKTFSGPLVDYTEPRHNSLQPNQGFNGRNDITEDHPF
jgi:replicative DNA helicase